MYMYLKKSFSLNTITSRESTDSLWFKNFLNKTIKSYLGFMTTMTIGNFKKISSNFFKQMILALVCAFHIEPIKIYRFALYILSVLAPLYTFK